MSKARLIGTEERLGIIGVLLIAGGLAIERLSWSLIWLGCVLLFVTWGTLRQPPTKEK